MIGLWIVAVRDFNRTNSQTVQTTQTGQSSQINAGSFLGGSATPTVSAAPSTPPPSPETVFVFVQSGQDHEIVALSSQSGGKQIIYNDHSQSEKLKQIGNLTADGKQIVAILSSTALTDSGALVTISTDGKGTVTTLLAQFNTASAPVISPDGTKIAFISFNNSETAYGFDLYLMDSNGQHQTDLVHDTQSISQPVFSADGKEIAYVRQLNPSGSSIMTVPITGGTPKQVFELADQSLYDLAWGAGNNFAFVDGLGDQTNLLELFSGSVSAEQIATGLGRYGQPVFAPDGKTLSYSLLSGGTTNIYLYNESTYKSSQIGSGVSVIGLAGGSA